MYLTQEPVDFNVISASLSPTWVLHTYCSGQRWTDELASDSRSPQRSNEVSKVMWRTWWRTRIVLPYGASKFLICTHDIHHGAGLLLCVVLRIDHMVNNASTGARTSRNLCSTGD